MDSTLSTLDREFWELKVICAAGGILGVEDYMSESCQVCKKTAVDREEGKGKL